MTILRNQKQCALSQTIVYRYNIPIMMMINNEIIHVDSYVNSMCVEAKQTRQTSIQIITNTNSTHNS